MSTSKPNRSKPLKPAAHVVNQEMQQTANLVHGWEVHIAQLGARVDSFESELRDQGRRQEEGFERVERNFAQLFARVESATTRPIPWAIIVSGIVGISGLCVTIATGLALWANAYFGSSIRVAEARGNEAHIRLEKMSERYESKLESLTELIWTTRLKSATPPTSSASSSQQPPPGPWSPLLQDVSAIAESVSP